MSHAKICTISLWFQLASFLGKQVFLESTLHVYRYCKSELLLNWQWNKIGLDNFLQVIFKMDHFGNGVLIEQSRLNEVMEIQSGFYTFEKFRYMCILSGCDYLSSLQGIGLGKAAKVFKRARQSELKLVILVINSDC